MANRDFVLNGYTVEEVMKLGFDFFPKVIHSEDLLWLKEMYAAILMHDQLSEINYFSFAIRIKNETTGHIMVDHKLKRILLLEKIVIQHVTLLF